MLYRIGQGIALSLPLPWAYRVALLVSDAHYIFAHGDRRAVTENLRAIFPEKTKRQINTIRIWVFRNFAKYLVDFFRSTTMDRAYVEKRVKIVNLHYIDEALEKKKGVIILTAHLGNWELGGLTMGILGYPLWAVALPHKEKRVNDFFNFQRSSKGVHVIPLGKAVRACLNVFRENKILALVGDRDFTEKGIMLDFFGKPTFLPEGPAAFSLKSGASIIPAFVVRNCDDTFTLSMEPPLEYIPTGNKEKDLIAVISLYKEIFERYIRNYPDQWYTFRKFWS